MKILLLEDHAAMRGIVADHLRQRGFVVDAIGEGEAAIVAAGMTTYDAMILDLGLPDMDGLDVLARIRERMDNRLPVLIVTARDILASRLAGLNAGADDYILKPFDLAELEARVRAVLRRPGRRAVDAYRLGRLRFDPATRLASVDDAAFDLSRKEAALLEELLRASGRLVVKDALEDRLYSFDEEVTSNAVEAVVSRLRKKLGASEAGVRIATARGIGYRLHAEDGGDAKK